MSLDGIITNDNVILNMRETMLYGMKVFIAENIEDEKIHFIRHPENYINIGRDENFAQVFMSVEYMKRIGYEHKK